MGIYFFGLMGFGVMGLNILGIEFYEPSHLLNLKNQLSKKKNFSKIYTKSCCLLFVAYPRIWILSIFSSVKYENSICLPLHRDTTEGLVFGDITHV